MPIFRLNDEIIFPPVELAEESGILAIDGDLSPERLIAAYRAGIFPWFSEGEPIYWWAPDPRLVLYPSDLTVSKSMRQVLRKEIFKITYDQAFAEVMIECSKPRDNQDGTWITKSMLEAYQRLHELGLAHSVEAWEDGELVGGLYGISLGRCFFGESMFTRRSNASKTAFITLSQKLQEHNFTLIDCQVYSNHLSSLGAIEISRKEFINKLNDSLKFETLSGNWNNIFQNSY